MSLFLVLAVLGLVVNGSRLGLDLAGGRLLPVGSLGELWTTYLSGWHQIGGGTASAAPASLAVLGALGAIFTPIGGPHALVAVLLIGDAPLAGLSAYAATRKLPASRWSRVAAAAGYALLPAATASVAQGRLDVVVVHIVLPLVISGIAGLLARTGAGWLPASSACAVGVAVLGAFSPLAQGLALLGLVVGFVVLPPGKSLLRRIASVVVVVVLPLVLLLPWPTVLVNQPSLVLHGLSGPAPAPPAADLVGLDPAGAGAWPIGVAVVVAAIFAVAIRPRALMSPGLGVLVLGACGLAVVLLVPVSPLQGGADSAGFTGVPLLVISAGLLWIVLTALAKGPPVAVLRKLAAAGAVLVILALATGAVLAGRGGPVRSGGGDRLASVQADELARTGRSVLAIGFGDVLTRQTGGRLPRFGDEQIAVTASTPSRLATWESALRQPSSGATRAALEGATASGALFVVLPPGEGPGPIVTLAPDLAVAVQPTKEGRTVLRLLAPSGQVVLVPPGIAKQAVTSSSPSSSEGVTPVDAALPDVRVRVSDGIAGRLLVLSAELEAGWQATVDGKPQPIVPAWGHQVAVSLPAASSEVSIEHPSTLRDVLLLVQVAAALFAAMTAIPIPARPR
ncbi:YfhO family protein [Amycolatopsis alkalitolerans]|uniref:YfhO family protein n=1 Tax=Amycolatopsis alkalitolerans TaxID=2547244 RepID=UPI001F25E28E|nr:YfhO family protein [Amycolatopsis alkalitolerans]